eukprot:4462696-Prymnesium_polylepis.1
MLPVTWVGIDDSTWVVPAVASSRRAAGSAACQQLCVYFVRRTLSCILPCFQVVMQTARGSKGATGGPDCT